MKHKKRNDNILIVEDFDQVFIEEELISKTNYLLIIFVFGISTLIGMFVVDVMKEVELTNFEENKKKS